MEKIWYAKWGDHGETKVTVRDHLTGVSERAAEFGAAFGREEEARLAGMFHDFGKYSEAFQMLLLGARDHVDHAVCGAAMLWRSLGQRDPKTEKAIAPIIEAVNGHHDGLIGYEMIRRYLSDIMERTDDEISVNGGKTPALLGPTAYREAATCFRKDFPGYRPKLSRPRVRSDVGAMLYTRMLFSCLVDADYSVSASDKDPQYIELTTKDGIDAEAALARLYALRDEKRAGSRADRGVNRIRDELFDRCGEVGEHGPEGLYTLTAPTGTGKTLALLHLALRHCARYGKRRIIVVLPYLALTVQLMKEYRKVFDGDQILEDHSQSGLSDEARDLASRWTVPVIVTTTVKFFESLFADRPTDCRKLHSIADSVIVFDEAQSLPWGVTRTTLEAVKELCGAYRCTMVFSTATQPDFGSIPDLTWEPTEIVPDGARMYEALRRVRVDWRIRNGEEIPLDQVAKEMAERESVCAIVDLRRHARKLYRSLAELCGEEGTFFLTTDLCPAHRKAVVEEIRERLDAGRPCRVVATQCIEAGVDLDFDAMWRALAPLDAIIQAAGRCNRNGRLDHGDMIVFVPDEEGTLYPDDWYGNAALIVKELSLSHPIDIDDPAHIKEYYALLFEKMEDDPKLVEAVEDRDFQEVAKTYKIIKEQGVRVIVPYQEELFQAVREEAMRTGMTAALMRKAAPITVTTFQKDIDTYAEPLLVPLRRDRGQRGSGQRESRYSGYYILREQYLDPEREDQRLYTKQMGLQFPETAGGGPIW